LVQFETPCPRKGFKWELSIFGKLSIKSLYTESYTKSRKRLQHAATVVSMKMMYFYIIFITRSYISRHFMIWEGDGRQVVWSDELLQIFVLTIDVLIFFFNQRGRFCWVNTRGGIKCLIVHLKYNLSSSLPSCQYRSLLSQIPLQLAHV
jgi:hypothetical protein